MAESTQKKVELQFHAARHGPCAGRNPDECPAEEGNTMAKERVTKRQKDISRLLREQKKTGKPKPHLPKKKK
jgi:hypothetical protein